MNENTRLVSPTAGLSAQESSRKGSLGLARLVLSFLLGVAVTFFATAYTKKDVGLDVMQEQAPMMGSPSSNPPLHYFGKAKTEFAATLPLMVDRDNSFLADLVTR